MDATAQLAALRHLHGAASLQQEASQPCVYLPAFVFTVDDEGRTMDLLLYRPVADEDYLNDRRFGAVMGSDAIRKAQQWALSSGVALLHVHTHGGRGFPGFSSDDLSENPKFVADFFKVAPQCAHGAIVLSDTAARGQIWLQRGGNDLPVDTFQVVGAPLVTWQVPT